MISRRILAAVAMLCAFAAPAYAQKTKSALTTEINTNWPDNVVGAITPATLRSTILDIVNSYYDLNGGTSLTCAAHQWVAALPTLSSITCTQPAFSDLSGSIAPSQIPPPTATTLGGVESYATASHQWINTISTAGAPGSSQPAIADVSGWGTNVASALGNPLNASGGLVGFSGNIGTASGTSLALGGASIGSNALAVIGSTSLGALTTGAAQAAGVSITGAATGGTVAIGATDTGANTNLTLDAKGGGQVTIGLSSGSVRLGVATTISGAITYGGVTLNNAVTGTGNMVLSSGPSITLGNASGLPIAGTTGWGTGVAAALAINLNASGGIPSPALTRAGDVIYWNGSAYVTLAGNNSGTQVLQENASGVPSWATVSGTGTLTTLTAGYGVAFTSGSTCSTSCTVSLSASTITNSLGSNVTLNSSTYTDGPSIAQGTTGTWWASGTVTISDTSAQQHSCKLWDGTTVIASTKSANATASANVAITLSGPLTSPAANIRISCLSTDNTATMNFNASGSSKDSTISAHRIQ